MGRRRHGPGPGAVLLSWLLAVAPLLPQLVPQPQVLAAAPSQASPQSPGPAADSSAAPGPPLGETACEVERMLRPAPQSPPMGEDVRELQQGLAALGLYSGPLDGVYLGMTVEAVRNFQARAGLVPDGVVGRRTWESLARAYYLLAVHPDADSPSGAALPKPAGPSPQDSLPSPASTADPAAQAPGSAAPVSPAPSQVSPAATQSQADGRPQGHLEILVDVRGLTLTLLVDGAPYRSWPIAIGKWTTPTPIGEWQIMNKDYDPGGPFGTRWMGLNVPWGSYGIHGTDRPWSIGTSASAGCVRMHNRDVEQLFAWVPLGTVVRIVGETPWGGWQRTLRHGTVGQEVVAFQLALRKAGFDPGLADARFGPRTQEAVRRLQTVYGLEANGEGTADVQRILGLR